MIPIGASMLLRRCVLVPLLLTGCNGQLTVSVTDAPVDEAAAVTLQFTGMDVEAADGSVTRFDFSPPKSIDLLALEGGTPALLLDQPLGVDDYRAIRLRVSADGNGNDSYIDRSDGRHALLLDEADRGRLRVAHAFTVERFDGFAFTIDFDLRKSIWPPEETGDPYRLVPSLRMVANDKAGALAGGVAAGQVPDGCVPAVYVYSGHDATPDDVGGTNAPLNSGRVKLNDTGEYRYRVGLLPAGDYTAALTCEADEDEPDSNDEVVFTAQRDVTVEAGQDTPADF